MQTLRLVPVVSLASVADGLRLAEVLLEAGLPVMEITYRTACAAEALDAISSRFSELLLIAGTVLTPAQVDSAVAAGAQAIVSPGFTPQLASYCRSREIDLFPGVCTPSEVQMAAEAGLNILNWRLKYRLQKQRQIRPSLLNVARSWRLCRKRSSTCTAVGKSWRPCGMATEQAKQQVEQQIKQQPSPCPACGGSGQLNFFKGESRFLLSVEECPACCGFGYVQEDEGEGDLEEKSGK